MSRIPGRTGNARRSVRFKPQPPPSITMPLTRDTYSDEKRAEWAFRDAMVEKKIAELMEDEEFEAARRKH